MPRIDVALVYSDGRKEVVQVGRPADLIAFADTFEKVAPSEPYAVRELTWLAHRALRLEVPLEEWVETLDDITSDEEMIDEIRAELAGSDPPDAVGEAATELRPAPEPTSDQPATESGIESLG